MFVQFGECVSTTCNSDGYHTQLTTTCPATSHEIHSADNNQLQNGSEATDFN